MKISCMCTFKSTSYWQWERGKLYGCGLYERARISDDLLMYDSRARRVGQINRPQLDSTCNSSGALHWFGVGLRCLHVRNPSLTSFGMTLGRGWAEGGSWFLKLSLCSLSPLKRASHEQSLLLWSTFGLTSVTVGLIVKHLLLWF
jgi:hypothetical protein